MRNLIIVLGDQLDAGSSAFDDFDSQNDVVWMAENAEETTHVWNHKLRIAMFLSAMRHFRDEQRAAGRIVEYHALTECPSADRGSGFGQILSDDIRRLQPKRLIVCEPGDYRVWQCLQAAADDSGLELDIRSDRHFYCSISEFHEYAEGRKGLLLEYFYRHLRKKHDVLMNGSDPVGDQWNFDHDNRESFGKKGPQELPRQKAFRMDDTSRDVVQLVESRFPEHPGSLDAFTLPVTRRQATSFLRHFISKILPEFGRWEDAMWTDEAFLFHSRLSAPLNLKLLSPRECVDAAVAAYEAGDAPLNSVEGFVRQILGWREFVRGVYWLKMPEYAELNHFNHQEKLPAFFWDGDTHMNCVRQSMQHVIQHGYSHHIQRLMVLGNFAQLWGAHPYEFHEWHMAMYVDAVDWVSLPNTLGMSQFGDGGVVGTKPYCSSGNYINKMSNFCSGCKFDYRKRVGETACPFTTLYWEFMDRHHDQLKDNPRMKFPMKNLEKLRTKPGELAEIRQRANQLREHWRATE